MTPEALAVLLGGELLDEGESLIDDECSWGGCQVVEPLVLRGDDTWCLEHFSDEALPELFRADGVGACEQCGRGTAVWTRDRVRLHEQCRRDYKARRVVVTKLRGAYARRARGRAGG